MLYQNRNVLLKELQCASERRQIWGSWGDSNDEHRGVTKGIHGEAGDQQSNHAEEGSGADRFIVQTDEED